MLKIKENISNKKVFVGMSGGVDSSVSAYLLKKAGYDVTGVFIKTWHPDFLPCTWQEEKRDAMRACAKLGIPFLLLNAEEEYKKSVADYMIAEYTKGRTPNPDVMCNKYVKFGAFFDFAMKNGADYIATGHYAQVKDGILFESKDTEKDQTYFLWTLQKKHLEKTLFPIGHLEKKEVRSIAKKIGLLNAEKKDSQGVCFLGAIDMKEFITHFTDVTVGNALNEKGEVIGEHRGSILYTIGERHGFTIHTKKGGENTPFYIISKDIEKNTITVSEQKPNEIESASKEISLTNAHMTKEIPKGTSLSIRLRYRQELQDAVLVSYNKETISLTALNPQQIVPGQSCVLYKDGYCIGGGIVE